MAAKKKEEGVEIDVLKEAYDRLNKLYGEGTVITGDMKSVNIEAVSTGSLLLDIATGIGGFPYGRIVEIIGPESTGKTTLCGHLIANAQKVGKKAAYIDMEHAISADYMTKLGVNMADIILSQPDYGEQALEIAHQLLKTGKIQVIIIDSVATLVPKNEVDGAIGDTKMAGIGRLMSQALRTLSPLVEQHNCLLVFTNQIRMTPGVMYGSPEKPTGGESLKFYASMRIDMRKTPDKVNELNKTRIKVIKSKVSKPFQECEVNIIWGKGFDRLSEVVDIGSEIGVIHKAGGHHSWGESKLGKSYDETIKFLQDNPEVYSVIEEQVLTKLKETA